MEVRPGYKQSDVGVIPEDWECVSVSQLVRDGILEKPLDGNHGNIHPKSGDFVSYGIPFVMANNVRGGCVDLSSCAFIRKEQADSLQKGFSRTGDVLLTHKATIGNTAVVGEIPFEYIMLTPQVTYYRVTDRTHLSNLYLRQFFDSSPFQSVLLAMSGGGTRAYIGITAQLQLPVVLPSTKAEQEAIAEALSDADALIESLELLLAKKRQLKRGAMQELLTGKKRLPGFKSKRGYKQTEVGVIPEDWEVWRLAEGIRLFSGQHVLAHHCNTDGDGVPYVTGPADFPNGAIEQTKFTTRPGTICRAGDVLVTVKGSGAGAFVRANAHYCISRQLMAIRVTDWNTTYVYFSLLHDAALIGAAATGLIPGLSRSDILNKVICFPPVKAEQEAIAAILSDMDGEIATLEARLAKARQLKQGMMQELLTGRIRLV